MSLLQHSESVNVVRNTFRYINKYGAVRHARAMCMSKPLVSFYNSIREPTAVILGCKIRCY